MIGRASGDQQQRLRYETVASPLCAATLAAFAGAAAVAQAPIVNPGAPGAAARTLNADEAIALARTAYTSADVQFLRDMMPHHQQAIDMAALAKDRTNRKELLDAAGRIDASQKDEIEFMQQWLEERNELAAPSTATATADDASTPPTTSTAATAGTPAADHAAHAAPGGMKGMATPEQMAALAAANGTDFDRLFLTLMIKHHEGAVEMVEELTEQPGAAYEPSLFEFTRDVTNDQNAEIERMNKLLIGLSTDARANLKPGFTDAGEADPEPRQDRVVAEAAGLLRSREPGQSAAEAARGARRRGQQRRAGADAAATKKAKRRAAATRARRCCRSRTRTSRFATTSWSSAAITASTSTACKPTPRSTKSRSSSHPSSAPAARATSRSSATC